MPSKASAPPSVEMSGVEPESDINVDAFNVVPRRFLLNDYNIDIISDCVVNPEEENLDTVYRRYLEKMYRKSPSVYGDNNESLRRNLVQVM